ncbi:MAG: hypothetical protein LBI54_10085 [Lachnospiraceae bacterium]|nr:hypothetical protein [Lachnospiraceae bacterium]
MLNCPVGNVKECPCHSETCKNHGKCCDCVVNHRNQGNLPACLRFVLEEKEK